MKQRLLSRLSELPDQIANSRRNLLNRQIEMEQAEQRLKDAEARLLTMDFSPINGRNAETREAQLWQETRAERGEIVGMKNRLGIAQIEHERLVNELACVRAAVRLISVEVE